MEMGFPLAFSFPKMQKSNRLLSKPLEKKVLGDFGCQKFIYCSDAGLGSESIWEYNYMGERAYIVNPVHQKAKERRKRMGIKFTGI